MTITPPLPRTSLPNTPPDYHGALDYAELKAWGYGPEDVIDFSVNSNPFGTLPAVREEILKATLDRYPDKESFALREALAEHHQISSDRIVVGNGTAELIWQIAFAYLEAGDRVGVVTPTFGEYARNCRLMGAQVESIDRYPLDHYPSYRMVFICHPNNPTGELRDLTALTEWADAHPATLFVVDEAYLNFVGLTGTVRLNRPNIITLRSMTKDYALAGVRLGYVVAHPDVISTLKRVRVPWNVSEIAQVAGVSALKHHTDYTTKWRSLQIISKTFKAQLTACGFKPEPSSLHYFLLNVGHGATFRDKLLRHGIIVRNCESFGLPHMVRIATRLPDENARLLDALRA